ncbi:MAG: hypothetical protein OEV23_07525 [Gallionella sp.]|nr:hypothetical protein [Gallionella sp.]
MPSILMAAQFINLVQSGLFEIGLQNIGSAKGRIRFIECLHARKYQLLKI